MLLLLLQSIQDCGLPQRKVWECVGVKDGGGQWDGVLGSRLINLGRWGCQVFLAAERVLAVVDGVSQFLQHHLQRGVLWQLHHEHTGLHPDVTGVWLTWREERNGYHNKVTTGTFHGTPEGGRAV